jgi:hypothetical protein
MAHFELTEAERDLLAALCAAAANYPESGTLEIRQTLTLMTASEWKLLDSLVERLTILEYPQQHIIRLNW